MCLELKSGSLIANESEYQGMLRRFWIGCALMLPILFLSMSFHDWMPHHISYGFG